ncbi:MAG: DEAD/DEAH box helicase [Spirochaetia bacterium]|nr:DEAD/DEAH box helicase [Spirochaetia bacterium]
MQNIETFNELNLNSSLLKALKEVGYEKPSPIQEKSIPPLLEGQDIIGQAQTGTGKTAAFALPLLNRLDFSLHTTQILVLTPTRELSIQVSEAFQTYARHLENFHVLPVYGGQDIKIQLKNLRRIPQVVVGTPGRVMDHLRRKTLNLASLKAVVLDEADEMLRMGFLEDVDWILGHAPDSKQVALFSATMPAPIRKVAQKHIKNPVEIKIDSGTTTVKAIDQYYWQVSGVHKLDAITRILEAEEYEGILIFVRTRNATVELSEKLEARGHTCAALNGDITQARREKIVEQLKNKKIDIVIATDVAARGLDVKRITHVINFDIPGDVETYVHRIGRTGRAGRKGKAILFVSPRETGMLKSIEKGTRQKIERMQLPGPDAIADLRIGQFKNLIRETISSQNLDFFYDLVRQIQQDESLTIEKLSAVLAYLVQKDRPLRPQFKEIKEENFSKDKSRKKSDKKLDRKSENVQKKKNKEKPSHDAGMDLYRIEVGKDHGATAREIVGAIANEAGIEGRYINNIKIHSDFSVLELPEGMPKEIFQHLKKVRVCHRPLKIHAAKDGDFFESEKKKKKPSKHGRKEGRKGK